MSRRDLKHTAGQLSPPPGWNPSSCTSSASGSPVCDCSDSRVKSGLCCDLEPAGSLSSADGAATHRLLEAELDGLIERSPKQNRDPVPVWYRSGHAPVDPHLPRLKYIMLFLPADPEGWQVVNLRSRLGGWGGGVREWGKGVLLDSVKC